jgi:hypothetical protein
MLSGAVGRGAWDDPRVSTALLRLLALSVAGLCLVGVVVGVVMTGREGRITDLLAVAAVVALGIAWRLHSRLQGETVTD